MLEHSTANKAFQTIPYLDFVNFDSSERLRLILLFQIVMKCESATLRTMVHARVSVWSLMDGFDLLLPFSK